MTRRDNYFGFHLINIFSNHSFTACFITSNGALFLADMFDSSLQYIHMRQFLSVYGRWHTQTWLNLLFATVTYHCIYPSKNTIHQVCAISRLWTTYILNIFCYYEEAEIEDLITLHRLCDANGVTKQPSFHSRVTNFLSGVVMYIQ